MQLGTRYQNIDDGNIYRLYKYKNQNNVILKSNNGDYTITIPITVLKDEYIKITPHAMMNIMITDSESGFGDVYACVHLLNKKIDLYKPDLIVRQDIYRANSFQYGNEIVCGLCITEDTNISNNGITQFMEFNNIEYKESIMLYGDDTLNSIIDAINPSILKKIDNKLTMIKNNVNAVFSNYSVTGYMGTFKELLEEVSFIGYYRSLFNIMQVYWRIDLGPESHDGDNIILNDKQISVIENILRKRIEVQSVIKYGMDIDIHEKIIIPHILISDDTETIYIITYKELGNFPVDDDIARAMKIK